MPNNPVGLNDKEPPAGSRSPPPHSHFDTYVLALAAEHRGGALSQLHLALVMGGSVPHDLLARADGPRRERRGGALSQVHLALVMGGSVTHNILAHNGPAGIHDLMHGVSPVHV